MSSEIVILPFAAVLPRPNPPTSPVALRLLWWDIIECAEASGLERYPNISAATEDLSHYFFYL